MSCPVWNGALTGKDSNRLENLQKLAFKIILGDRYTSYKRALELLKLSTLKDRRQSICHKFSIKTTKLKKYQAWFPKTLRKNRDSKKYVETSYRTTTYKKSPLLYLTQLLNKN